MRLLAACLLLTGLVPSFASDGQSAVSTMAAHAEAKDDSKVVDRAAARAAASAGVANEREKSGIQSSKMSADRAKAEAKADKADAKVDKAKAKKEAEHKAKAAPPPPPQLQPQPGAVGDQSVCDLTPHPSWCDQ